MPASYGRKRQREILPDSCRKRTGLSVLQRKKQRKTAFSGRRLIFPSHLQNRPTDCHRFSKSENPFFQYKHHKRIALYHGKYGTEPRGNGQANGSASLHFPHRKTAWAKYLRLIRRRKTDSCPCFRLSLRLSFPGPG